MGANFTILLGIPTEKIKKHARLLTFASNFDRVGITGTHSTKNESKTLRRVQTTMPAVGVEPHLQASRETEQSFTIARPSSLKSWRTFRWSKGFKQPNPRTVSCC